MRRLSGLMAVENYNHPDVPSTRAQREHLFRNLNHSFSFKRGGASKFQTIAGYDLLLPTRTPGPCAQVDAAHKRCMNCLDMPAVAVKVSLTFSDTPRVGACEGAVKLVLYIYLALPVPFPP